MTYQLTNSSSIIRLADGASISPDAGNAMYQAYRQWLAAGGVPLAVASPTVAEVKAMQWERIKADRNHRKAGGFKAGSDWYHSDEPSRTQYAILLAMAVEKGLPVDTVLSPAWKDMAGAFKPMTVTLLRQIRDAGLGLEQQLFTVAQNHKTAMEASADPAAYNFATGWPASYSA